MAVEVKRGSPSNWPSTSRGEPSRNHQGGSYEETTISHSHGGSPGAERRAGPGELWQPRQPAVAAKPVSLDPQAGLPQNWDQVLPAATRFVVLQDFANAAVRDNETGLVWEHRRR